ncbi:MAG: alpha/beta fold hydrolase [Candidatus Neomicrothrix subdominans]
MTDPSPTPLVLLHGFTQNRQCWGPFAGQLDDGRPVERWDLPGHGGGGPAADAWATADRLAAQAAALTAATAAPRATTTAEAGARASDWLGYSLGGRMLLHLVLAHPNMVRRAVLIGATAGLATSAERAERRGADEALAERIEQDGVDAFIERWLALPMWDGLPEAAQFADERRTNTADGLAGSLRLAGTGAQDDLWPRLGEIDVPVLVLAGGRDQKFTAIGRRLAAALPHGEFRAIPDAGHAVHLEAPERTAQAVTGWLDA